MNMSITTDLPATSLFDLYDLMAPMLDDEPRNTGAKVDVTLTNLPQHVLDIAPENTLVIAAVASAIPSIMPTVKVEVPSTVTM